MATTTKFKIGIDHDTADHIVVCSLKEAIDTLEESITKIARRKKLSDYDRRELADQMDDLSALQKVYNYYGGNTR